jgi:hypothetical protein
MGNWPAKSNAIGKLAPIETIGLFPVPSVTNRNLETTYCDILPFGVENTPDFPVCRTHKPPLVVSSSFPRGARSPEIFAL